MLAAATGIAVKTTGTGRSDMACEL
jgi:hypothetical protein